MPIEEFGIRTAEGAYDILEHGPALVRHRIADVGDLDPAFCRRLRIAKGSGTSVAEVNRVLKSYAMMLKMMKNLKKNFVWMNL